MLALLRSEGESVIIGDEIAVKVVQVRERKVKLAISAPDSVSVHREEVYRRIEDEGDGTPPGELRARQVENQARALCNTINRLTGELHAERRERYRLEAEMEGVRRGPAAVRNGKDGAD